MQPLSTVFCEQEVLEKLGYDNIPRLPTDATALLEALADDDIDFARLARIIEQHPDIAARLLGVANSAWSNPGSPITRVDIACSRLGLSLVRNLSLALVVSAPFNTSRCPGFDCQYFWSRALLCADAAQWLAAKADTDFDGGEARTAGLLHNIGLLMLADQLPVEVHQSIQLVNKGDYPHLSDALQFMLGFNHCDVGRVLGQRWQLPDALIDAMSYLLIDEDGEGKRPFADLIRLATSMLASLQNHQPWPIQQEMIDQLGMEADAAMSVYERLFKQLERTRALADTLFGAQA